MIQSEKTIRIPSDTSGLLRLQLLAPLLASSLLLGLLSGCASGSFSSKSPGTPTPTNPAPNANPPSLPALTAATAVNDYAGTQSAAAAAPDNTLDLHIDQTNGLYRYTDIPLPGQQANPVPNSSGLFNIYQGFRNMGDTSGATGLPGAQYFGLAVEEPSRLAFFASNSSQAIAAIVPRQSSACITPTAAATYAFMTLPNAALNPATDPAWGTVQVSASGSAFTFGGAKQYTESSATASTSLIPFAASGCASSSPGSKLGHFIYTRAANGAEIRSFLGPTGLLVSDIQGTDQNGLPLAVPGFIGMVQPGGALDLASLTGSPTNPVLYRSFLYQPLNSPAVQYGFMGQSSGSFLIGVDNNLFASKKTPGLMGAWQGLTSFTFPMSATGTSGTGAFIFGSPDTNDPGLFPHAKFVYQITGACPAGTRTFASGYCSSPAVAIAGQHDGKYVILVSGIWVPLNNAPTLLVLVQN